MHEVIRRPQRLACITYHNDAVHEIESRLSTFGFTSDRTLFVGSVHGFCLSEIIFPYVHLYKDIEWPKNLTIADQDTINDAFVVAKQLAGAKNIDQTTFDKYRLSHPLNLQSIETFYQVWRKYEQLLRSEGLVDFTDIAVTACILVSKHALVRKMLVSRYPWIIVDEYQNLGYPFHRMIQELLNETRLQSFIVGDTDQSIYGFQSADPKYLEELTQRPDMETVRLYLNYRCGQRIIDGAEPLRPAESVHKYGSKREAAGEISFHQFDDGLQSQLNFVAKTLIPYHLENGYALGDIALLCRHRNIISLASATFSAFDINFSGSHDQKYERTPITRWLEQAAQWIAEGNLRKRPTFYSLFRTYQRFRRQGGIPIDDSERLHERIKLFSVLNQFDAPNMKVSEWIQIMDEELAFPNLTKQLLQTARYDVEAYEELKAATKPPDGALVQMTISDLARCGRSANSVFLSTLHGSQGLEFKVVIIPDLEDGRLPSYFAKRDGTIDEERRLLYVGITRAVERVYLLYSGWYDAGWKIFSDGRSPFITEIMNSLEEIE